MTLTAREEREKLSRQVAAALSSSYPMPRCLWVFDKFFCYYSTDCDNAYHFGEELQIGGSYIFCPGCGRRIEVGIKTELPADDSIPVVDSEQCCDLCHDFMPFSDLELNEASNQWLCPKCRK